MSFFTQTRVLNILDGKFPVVSVDKTTSVHDTLRILYDTGFSSLTVADPNIATYPKHIAGFIDLVDILAYLINLTNIGVTDANAAMLATAFLNKPVGDLMDYSTRDHFTAVLEEDELLKVISLLARDGNHRVAVVDILSDIRHVITQTDIIRVICEHIDELINVGRVTVRDLGVTHSNIIVVRADDSAISSLRIMNNNKLSAAPIVDGMGVLVGTLSISDLKGITSESLRALGAPTFTFSEQHSYRQPLPKAIMITLDSTFADVIRLVAHTRVHRVWIVDADHRPIGVIALTDICRIITQLHATESR
jgi:CBS domain-containing protein